MKCDDCPHPDKCQIRGELGFEPCMKKANEEKPRGVMVYEHKTGPTLWVLSKEAFEDYKAKNRRTGQQSILRNVTPNGGRKQ